ncbi:hypothetical protein FKW77_008990 [Venturia effusa]|uniref:Heterokaryon incompatibility domain-containing protein n=1 Tax=Venturia effusa TaxID=50376 RepID=A0A517LCW1_9PEZI|nr:hypothetical protein FKW77_008990 [Venturia effusa]
MNEADFGPGEQGKPEVCNTQDGFTYQSLDRARHQIRLLKICTGEPKVIACELHHFDSAKAPPYRAISYTWGTPEFSVAIALNGLSFHVRQNLWNFLHVAEYKYPNRWMWIDAICIDQDNMTERNWQVQMMQGIFGRAQEVLSWTGVAGGGRISSGLLAMIDTGFYSTYTVEHDVDKGGLLSNDRNDADFRIQGKKTRHFIEFVEDNYWAIQDFFSRAYWRRIWIIQEVRFAQKHSVMSGRTTITASKLNQFITSIKNRASWKGWERVLSYQYAWDVLNPPTDVSEFSLSNIVRTYQKSLCTDLRDRVYGIMSLVNQNVRMDIDYGISAFELYFLTLGRIAQTEWIHQTDDTRKCTEELRTALGLNNQDIDTSFVRLFVEHCIRLRPRLLTLEKWLGYLERKAKKGVRGKTSQRSIVREGFHTIENELMAPVFGSESVDQARAQERVIQRFRRQRAIEKALHSVRLTDDRPDN